MDLIKHIRLDYHEGALDAIDGKMVKPNVLTVDAADKMVKNHKVQSDLYRKSNSYAKSMITSAVIDAVYQNIKEKGTTYEVTTALKQNFEVSSKDQLFKICTDFFAFGWMQGEDVARHIAKLTSLWNELNNELK
ncbi:hypothetical protein GWI33_018497 [Rhynchophorus ferrugineus]|uniref:Uncharacterized protein n=1 Tax=Rhynchophorus ferrugineus TaxID=354439 RepID=A0A834HUQ9_RHYFE|nr:hypothetical protein GWI33_018497 [Rhynchophorus ferrugineus]